MLLEIPRKPTTIDELCRRSRSLAKAAACSGAPLTFEVLPKRDSGLGGTHPQSSQPSVPHRIKRQTSCSDTFKLAAKEAQPKARPKIAQLGYAPLGAKLALPWNTQVPCSPTRRSSIPTRDTMLFCFSRRAPFSQRAVRDSAIRNALMTRIGFWGVLCSIGIRNPDRECNCQ